MLTFVTEGRQPILSTVQYNGVLEPPSVCLSEYGKITEKYIENISKSYPYVFLDNYTIMPDHVHLLITVLDTGNDKKNNKSVASIIRATKNMISREIGESIWQLDFHDVVADTEKRFLACDKYIDENPAAWLERKEPVLNI